MPFHVFGYHRACDCCSFTDCLGCSFPAILHCIINFAEAPTAKFWKELGVGNAFVDGLDCGRPSANSYAGGSFAYIADPHKKLEKSMDARRKKLVSSQSNILLDWHGEMEYIENELHILFGVTEDGEDCDKEAML